MRAFEDHYATLGISPDASRKEILRARNRLLRQHHPDLNQGRGEEAKTKTLAILLAAKVLSDDVTRREYDRTYRYFRGVEPSQPGPGAPEKEEAPQGVACERCGRRNSWNRSYCLYCGAGIGEARDGVSLDETLFEEPPRQDGTTSALHFGCGSLMGLAVFGLFGFRAFAYSGLESALPYLTVCLIGVVATGAAAAKWTDRFWEFALRFFAMFVMFAVVLFVPFIAARQKGLLSDGAVSAIVFLVFGVALWVLAFAGRWRKRDRVRPRGRPWRRG